MGGDPAALEELKHRYGPAVHAVLLADGPPGKADELTDEVFRVAAGRSRSMNDAAAIGPWFLEVARERAARASGTAAKTGDMHRTLGVLSSDHAEMLVMQLAEGLRAEEIARAVGKTPAEVSEALAGAREKLGVETDRLERMLRTLRWTPQAPAAAGGEGGSLPKFVPILIGVVVLAAIAGFFLLQKKPEEGSKITWTAGKTGTEAFMVGQTLETKAGERARVAIGTIGHAEVEPYSEVTLTKEGAYEHRLTLLAGRLLAEVDAPPRAFVVAGPGADAVALGKASFAIDYSDASGGEVDVAAGAVSLVADGKPGAYVPAGACCRYAKATGPGIPYFKDAPSELQAVDPTSADVLTVPLIATREKDTLTLFHLLPVVDENSRGMVILKLMELAPPPASVSAEALTALDTKALAAYEAELRKLW